MTKIAFLDFDGVLNNTGSFLWNAQRKKDGLYPRTAHELANADPVSVALLDRLLDDIPELKIVVSSTWRREFSVVSGLQQVLSDSFGLRNVNRVIDRTSMRFSRGYLERGDEVNEWLQEYPDRIGITHYIIIDDVAEAFHENQRQKHLVHTQYDYGFQFPEYNKARQLLGLRPSTFVVF
jgi:hypothetical protein